MQQEEQGQNAMQSQETVSDGQTAFFCLERGRKGGSFGAQRAGRPGKLQTNPGAARFFVAFYGGLV